MRTGMFRSGWSEWRKVLLVLLITSPLLMNSPTAHAAGTLLVNPQDTNTLTVGSTFSVKIRVSSIDPFDAWDIQVSADQSVINATNISLIGNILSGTGTSTFTAVQCVNGGDGLNHVGCQPSHGDEPGVVHSALVSTGPTGLAHGNGLLFTITYNVVGTGYSDIQIFHDVLANGITGTRVGHTTVNGVYGVKPATPDYALSVANGNLNVTQGSKLNSTISLVSLNNFDGTIALSVNSSISGGLKVSLSPTTVHVSSGGANSSTLSIVTDNQTLTTQFTLAVTGTSTMLRPHSSTIYVSVLPPPDFVVSATPSLLWVRARDTNRTTVFVESRRLYSGTIRLDVNAVIAGTTQPVPGLTTSLDTNTLTLPSGEIASTTLTVETPAANVTFRYTVKVTATAGDKKSHSFDISVVPPPADFTFSTSALSLSVNPGSSGQLSVTIASQDYFEGMVYLFATSSSGTRLDFSPPKIPICIVRLLECPTRTESGASNFTLSLDPSIASGVHFVILTALGGSVTHTLNVTFTVPQTSTRTSNGPLGSRTILGLQPSIYFGIIAALGIGLAVAAVREVRRPKGSSRRTFLEDNPVPSKTLPKRNYHRQ